MLRGAGNQGPRKNKAWLGTEAVFVCKLRFMYWINALGGDVVIKESIRYFSPRICEAGLPRCNNRNGVSGNAPPPSLSNFNVDSSGKGQPGPAGCGGVLRDSEGVIRGLFPGPLGQMCSNDAEVYAIQTCLQLFVSSPWMQQDLAVESDSVIES